MTITTLTKLDFVQFLQQRPDDGIYELVNGEIVKVEAIRAHKNVARYLVKSFDRESERLGLDYIVDKDIVIRTVTNKGEQRGRNPDVSVVIASMWNANVTAYGALTEPIELAVEVVS
ncbi:MAG: Uma2 family endonuclease, partial [Dolichospermum sp.]